jgi:sortase A
MRRVIRDISSVLILSGLLLVADAGVTLVWQEPVTAAIGMVLRSDVNKSHLSYRTAPLSTTDTRALAGIQSLSARIAYLARRERDQVKTGDAIGQIQIPRIGHTYNVIEGTDTRSLEAGPGHLPGPVSVPQPAHRGRPDLRDDALRQVHLRRPVPADRQPVADFGDRRRRL